MGKGAFARTLWILGGAISLDFRYGTAVAVDSLYPRRVAAGAGERRSTGRPPTCWFRTTGWRRRPGVEILRHQIMAAKPHDVGWLAAHADPLLSRCLSVIHDDPGHEWTLGELASASGVSRSALGERFQAILGTSPIRNVRAWRLYLASVALATTAEPIATIAYSAGYATEAAFNRAFGRAFGTPPGAWRAAGRV